MLAVKDVIPAGPGAVPQAPPPANLDALTASLAAQANAIAAQSNYLTFATLVLGLIAVFLTFGWGLLVKIWAEKAAKDAVAEWMNKNANDLISQRLAVLMPPETDGGGLGTRPPMTQEEQEKGLSGDPTKEPG
ncbi:hypothetical protein [Phenylobacterium sp. SCN 70-31]|uniref:hypothetical protein n=1 Tax=Phenylobacterium sp. SCN 70-31 TaxID=1660129 RepID=UPI0025E7CADC|nr:hypothetical protein [Phenylobacterium sp. SCN 70-31]